MVAALLMARSFVPAEYDASALRDPFRAPERSRTVGIVEVGEHVCAIVRDAGGAELVIVRGDSLDGCRVETIDSEGVVLRTREGAIVRRELVEEGAGLEAEE